MDNLFLILLIFSIVALVYGQKHPDSVLTFLKEEKRTKKNVAIIFGSIALLSFILFGLTVDSDDTSTPSSDENSSNVSEIKDDKDEEEEEDISLLALSEEEKELFEKNYGELSWGDQYTVNNILGKNIDEYEEEDRVFIEERRERIEKEKYEFEEKERKEKEEDRVFIEERRERIEKEMYNTGITRNDIARDKNGLMGQYVKFEGKIVQVLQGDGYNQYRLAVGGDYDQMILIEIDDILMDRNIIEDDYITIDGQSMGNMTYTTVLGAKQTIPAVLVDNVYFN